MIFDLPLMLMIVVFFSVRYFSQWLANKIKWPSIVVMAIVGLLVGPVLGIANLKEAMGSDVFSSISYRSL